MFDENDRENYLKNIVLYKSNFTDKLILESGFLKKNDKYIGNEESFDKLCNEMREYFGFKQFLDNNGNELHISNFSTVEIVVQKLNNVFTIVRK